MDDVEKRAEEIVNTQIIIENLATPYRAFIPVSDEDLQVVYDKEWEENQDNIIRASNYKGKKLKGGGIDKKKARKAIESRMGVSAMYEEPLAHYASERILAETGKDVILTNAVSVRKDGDASIIMFNYYYYPEVIFDKELDWNCDKGPQRDSVQEFTNRCTDLQYKHRSLELLEDGSSLTEDTEVVIDIIAAIDGKSYAYGTVKNHKTMIGDLTSPELLKAVLEHKKGDLFTVTYVNPLNDKDNLEKTVDAQVRIHEAYKVTLLDLDDELIYTSAGFDSKAAFRAKFDEDFAKYVKNAESQLVANHIMSQIMSEGTIEPIPQQYINLGASSIVRKHYAMFGGDKDKALSAVQCTEGELIDRSAQQVMQDVIQKMGWRKYAQIFDYAMTVDTEELIDDMLERVNWVEKKEELIFDKVDE